MNIKGSKHLTLGERIAISELLIQNKSLNEIAKAINKNARTVSKEIKRSKTQEINNRYIFSKNYPEYCKRSFIFQFVCVSCDKRSSCHHKYKFSYDPQFAQKKYELSVRDSRTGLDCSLEEMALTDEILTDRGLEFTNPNTIEKYYKTGRKIMNIFYCNSYASYQKGSIEQNHELIRYVIPKGHIFDNLNQNDIDKLVSHINSYYRESIETTP